MKPLVLSLFPGILRFLLHADLPAISHFFFHLFKLMSEIFGFANPPNVDGNMIMEAIPPVRRRTSPPFLGRTPFEVCWSPACIRSLRQDPWRVCAPFFPCVGHSCGIPDCFALTGIDYLVSFVLNAFLSNILAICCLTPVFILCTGPFQ